MTSLKQGRLVLLNIQVQNSVSITRNEGQTSSPHQHVNEEEKKAESFVADDIVGGGWAVAPPWPRLEGIMGGIYIWL